MMGRAQRNPSSRPRIIDDELSAQLRSGRQLLFHSQSRRSKFTAPDRSYRSSANGFSIRTHPACIMIDAIVVLPDHLHAIWSLPEGDADFATRWRHVKAMFSRALPARERISESRLRKGE